MSFCKAFDFIQDSKLSKYDIVILDEAHERSTYTDILFALVKSAVIARNGSLRLVVTSATLNTEQFSKYFNNCPFLPVSSSLISRFKEGVIPLTLNMGLPLSQEESKSV